MDPIFSFQITALDSTALYPQVSRALEKRTELLSRQKCPRMWKLTDKLNSVEKVPQAVREKRRNRRAFLGLLNWVFGVFLLMPGLMDPQELLIPLLVGAVGYGAGVVTLWRTRRTLLGILSLGMGVVLCVGALGDPAKLGRLLILAITGIVIGIGALLTRKQKKRNPFDRAAQQLLEKNIPEGMEQMRVSFSSAGITVGPEHDEEGHHTVPFSNFDFVLETEDLLLPVYNDTVTILQKKDLLTGTIPELREFLGKQTRYVRVQGQSEKLLADRT